MKDGKMGSICEEKEVNMKSEFEWQGDKEGEKELVIIGKGRRM